MVTRYTLTVPYQHNDGSPVPTRYFAGLESDLVAVFGGFTLHDAEGAWRNDDGRVYHEPVRVYTLDTATPDEVEDELRDLAGHIARTLDQDAVYITAQALAATFLVTQDEPAVMPR